MAIQQISTIGRLWLIIRLAIKCLIKLAKVIATMTSYVDKKIPINSKHAALKLQTRSWTHWMMNKSLACAVAALAICFFASVVHSMPGHNAKSFLQPNSERNSKHKRRADNSDWKLIWQRKFSSTTIASSRQARFSWRAQWAISRRHRCYARAAEAI